MAMSGEEKLRGGGKTYKTGIKKGMAKFCHESMLILSISSCPFHKFLIFIFIRT